MEIKPILTNIAKKSITTFNEIGNFATNTASKAKNKALANDTFVKYSNKAKDANIDKETLIGLGISTVAVILAAKCIKSIKHSLTNLKQNK